MKYAIVESGGKQYRAVEGSTIEVDLLPVETGKEATLEHAPCLTGRLQGPGGAASSTRLSTVNRRNAHAR